LLFVVQTVSYVLYYSLGFGPNILVLLPSLTGYALQAESVSAAGADSASAWYRVVPATSVGCGQSQLDRRDAATAAANSSNVPAAAARRTPSINRRSASAHRNATRFDD